VAKRYAAFSVVPLSREVTTAVGLLLISGFPLCNEKNYC